MDGMRCSNTNVTYKATAPSARGALFPVLRLLRKYPPHTAARIGIISCVTRNEMDVHVRNRLARRRSVVDAYVIRGRMKFGIEPELCLVHQLEHRKPLFDRRLEKGRYMTLGNDQRVPRRNRIAVANRDREVVRNDDALWRQRAERASVHCAG